MKSFRIVFLPADALFSPPCLASKGPMVQCLSHHHTSVECFIFASFRELAKGFSAGRHAGDLAMSTKRGRKEKDAGKKN